MASSKGKREVAWRIFASEFNSATVELPSQDQYAPSYVLSPLGAMINRIYLTGVLTECENIGTDQEPLWRGRVSDSTDVFYVSAGMFQPKAARILADFEVPSLVGIVGKARTYSPDDLTTYVSVRVEYVREISQDIRNFWILDACENLFMRLGCITQALYMETPNSDKLVSLGFSNSIANSVIQSIDQYGDIEVKKYQNLLINTMKELTNELNIVDLDLDSLSIESELPIVMETPIKPPKKKGITIQDANVEGELEADIELDTTIAPEPEMSESEAVEDDSNAAEIWEQLVLEIITGLSLESPDGVVYEAVQAQASEQGLEVSVIEECLGSLIDKGVIYEPSIGFFKKV